MRIRNFLGLCVACAALSTASVAAPLQDVPAASTDSQQSTTIMDELVVTGATEQGRAVPLDASEAARPVARNLPQVDAQAWLPQADQN